jgi:hypothetical protein
MPIRLPGLDIREPLRSRPISGGVIGGMAGTAFALLADAGAFRVAREVQSMGFVIGGVVTGVVIGSLAPLFRKRLGAGLTVWLAATLGLAVANSFWHEFPETVGSILLGFMHGAVYACVFWDYRGESGAPK